MIVEQGRAFLLDLLELKRQFQSSKSYFTSSTEEFSARFFIVQINKKIDLENWLKNKSDSSVKFLLQHSRKDSVFHRWLVSVSVEEDPSFVIESYERMKGGNEFTIKLWLLTLETKPFLLIKFIFLFFFDDEEKSLNLVRRLIIRSLSNKIEDVFFRFQLNLVLI